MILLKSEILKAIDSSAIVITPAPKNIGPNSIDITLGHRIMETIPGKDGVIDTMEPGQAVEVEPTAHNQRMCWVLYPGRAYLGYTAERTFTPLHVPILETRSSAARLGLSIHYAGFGDIGFDGQWTLEITVNGRYPIRVYPGQRVGQVYFLESKGNVEHYKSQYQGQSGIRLSKGLG